MPLLTSPRTSIELPVADKIYGDTVIKQKAVFASLNHAQFATGESVATVSVQVRSYSLSGGTYGESLHDKGVPDRLVTLVADNKCVVDAETGAILTVRGTETNKEWQAIVDGFDQPVMLQGDFFELLREQPIKIGDLIRLHITQADAMGKFLA